MSARPHIDGRQVHFNAPTPKLEERWIPVAKVLPGKPLRGTIISQRPLSVLTHWVCADGIVKNGRTVPHLGTDDRCALCVSLNQVPRWQSYVAIWLTNPARYALLQITLNAAQTCAPLQAGNGLNLRGLPFEAARVGKAANSPVVIRLTLERVAEELLPVEVNVRPALLRLWGCSSSGEWVVQ